MPGFNLVRVQDLVPQLEGQVNAHAEVRGTIGKPIGKLDADDQRAAASAR